MPSIKTKHFIHQETGREYEIDLSLNDEAIMEDNVEMEITGRFRDSPKEEWVEVVFTVQLSLKERRINVLYSNALIGYVSLDVLESGLDEAFDAMDGPAAWDHLRDFFDKCGGELHDFIVGHGGELSFFAGNWQSSGIEEAIHHIPTDPAIGCLLKAGISTAVGQLIRCYSEPIVKQMERLRQKVLAILRCLGINVLSMAGTFTYRTIRCAITHGLH